LVFIELMKKNRRQYMPSLMSHRHEIKRLKSQQAGGMDVRKTLYNL